MHQLCVHVEKALSTILHRFKIRILILWNCGALHRAACAVYQNIDLSPAIQNDLSGTQKTGLIKHVGCHGHSFTAIRRDLPHYWFCIFNCSSKDRHLRSARRQRPAEDTADHAASTGHYCGLSG